MLLAPRFLSTKVIDTIRLVSGDYVSTLSDAVKSSSTTAHRPGPDTLCTQDVLSHTNLFGGAGLGRIALTTVGVPGGESELKPTIVRWIDDGPVARRFTSGYSVPVGVGRSRGGQDN